MNKVSFKVSLLATGLLISGCGGKNFALPPTAQQTLQSEQLNTKVDVILMVDNSSSMLRHQQKLVDQLPSLISALNAQGMDWRIGVTTSDYNGSGGILEGNPGDEFISASTPDALAKLQYRAMPGENGSDLERGIETVKSSLQALGGGLRTDAMLSIIFLSDDNDYSSTTSSQFVSFVDSIKPRFRSGLRSWVANYIGTVQLTQECTQSLGKWNGVGQKYIDIVAATGGTSDSICSASLGQAVSNVRVRMDELLTEISLARVPKVETVVVTVNGQVVPQSTTDGWEYISGKNVIKFHGSQIPKPNDLVNVSFDPAGAT